MSRFLDRAGTFKARAVSWAAREIPTGAIAVRVQFTVHEVRNGEVWAPCEERGVTGDFFVLKPTGAENEKVHDMLRERLGWQGRLAELYEGPPRNDVVQVQVEAKEHKGKTYYQVGWIREADAEPRGAGGDMDAQRAAAIDAKRGVGKPAAPPRDRDAGRPVADYGDIPF